MIYTSLGDLSHSAITQRLNTRLQSDVSRLALELSTGESSDPVQYLAGDFRLLSSVEHRKQTAQAHEIVANEARGFAAAMQSALGRVQSSTQSLYSDLITATEGASDLTGVVARQAETSLGMILSALNTSFAGRSLFAGNATNGPAVGPAKELLDAVRARVEGETTLDGITAAIKEFFEAPDGFQSQIYRGSDQNLSPFTLGENESVQLNMRADVTEIRSVLANTVLAVISTDIGTPELQKSMQSRAGLALFEDQEKLTALRADLGFAEARIEELAVATASERTALDFARGSLIGIDEFETATRLENTQFQIEALYAVTARLSGLSLLRYL